MEIFGQLELQLPLRDLVLLVSMCLEDWKKSASFSFNYANKSSFSFGLSICIIMLTAGSVSQLIEVITKFHKSLESRLKSVILDEFFK